MADLSTRRAQNAAGAFFVDESCIDCDLCRQSAPASFARDDVEGFSFVFRQPVGDVEREAARKAQDECPVEAIGSDGEG